MAILWFGDLISRNIGKSSLIWEARTPAILSCGGKLVMNRSVHVLVADVMRVAVLTVH